MGEILELVIILWLISPIILFILYLLEKRKRKESEQEKQSMQIELNILRAKLDKTGTRTAGSAYDASARSPDSPPGHAPDKTSAGAYDYSSMYQRPQPSMLDRAAADKQPVFTDESRSVQNTAARAVPAVPDVPERPAQAENIQPVSEDISAVDIHGQVSAAGSPTSSNDIRPADVQPADDQPSQPVYTYTNNTYAEASYRPAEKPVKKIAPINIILALGTLFVSLAGFVFAGTQWSGLPALGKGAVLVSFSVLFFILHLVTEKKLDLPSAGKIFYILGSVFLPAAVFSAAVLKVFGNDFSFSDGNGGLVVAVMALCTGVCALIGAVHYDSRRAARCGYIALTLAAASIIIYLDGVAAAIELSVAAFAVMFFEGTVKRSERVNRNLKSEYSFFVTENIYVSALVSLFLSDGTHIFAVPVLIFAASFLISALRRNHGGADISAFCAYLAVGAYLAVRPENADGGILVLALLMIVYSVLNFMDMIPEELRRIVSVVRMIASVILIAAGIIMALTDTSTNLSVMISAVCVLAQLMISAYRGDRASLYAQAPAAVFMACEAGKLFGTAAPAAAAAICLIWLVAVRFAKRFYTRSADITVTLFAAAELVYSVVRSDASASTAFAVWAILIVCTVISAFTSKGTSVYGAVSTALASLAFAMPVHLYTGSGEKTLAAVAVCQFILSSLPLIIPRKEAKVFVKPFEAGWAAIAAVSVLTAAYGISWPYGIAAPLCVCAYFIIRSIIIHKSTDVGYIFDFGSDIAFCAYFAVMLLMPAPAQFKAAVFVCLLITAALSDRRVRAWALPAAMLMMFIPLRGYTSADTAGVITASAYGLTAAGMIYLRKDIYKKFIYLFPALFIMVITAVDMMLAYTIAAVGIAAMVCTALMHIRNEHGGIRMVLTAVTCASYVLMMTANVNTDDRLSMILGVVLWLFTAVSFGLGRDKISEYLFPVALISLYFPIVMFGSWKNTEMLRDIAGAASGAVFLAGMYMTGGKRTAFKATAPLMFVYPWWIYLAYGDECSFTIAGCTAVMLMLYSTGRGEGRSLRRIAALCISLVLLYITAVFSASISVYDIAARTVFMLVWLCIPVVLTREHILHKGTVEEIGVVISLAASYIPFMMISDRPGIDCAEVALIAMTAVMCIYRLLCMTGKLITPRASHFIMPLAMILLVRQYLSASVLLGCTAVVFAVSLTDAYQSANDGLRRYIYPSFAGFVLLAYRAARYMCETGELSHDTVYIAVTAAAVLVFLLSLVSDGTTGRASGAFSFAVMPFASAYMMYTAADGHSTAVLVCGYVLAVIASAAAIGMENTVLLYLMFPFVHLGTYNFIGADDSTILLTLIPAAAAAVFGRLYFRDALVKTRKFTDAFALTAVLGIMPIFSSGDDILSWWGGVALTLWFLLLYRKGDRNAVRYTSLTLASCMIIPLWCLQPFFEVPDIIKTEVSLVPFVIALALLYLIHRDHRPVVDTFAFGTAVIELLILFFDAARTGYAFDAVFLGAVILCILGLSFIFRQKRWFALAVCSAAAEALLMTIKLWNSRIWWVYLLIAGVILIAVGLGNEMKKKRIEQGKKTKLEQVMEEWTW
ncbi:MAG: hypothetical protein ILP19_07715 [Oscillospiraceae bacterium]|nr:hypothetical protein [Oscillospiraceae bacterium]